MARRDAATLSRVVDVFTSFCIGVGSPRALKAALLARNGEWDQLMAFKVHPSEYLSPSEFAGDYAVTNFLRKCQGLPVRVDTAAAALQAFEKSEDQCALTNARVEGLETGANTATPEVNRVLHAAALKISRLLARCDPLSHRGYSWGPGATFCLSRKVAYPDTKLTRIPISVTPAAKQFSEELLERDLHWKHAIQHDPEYCPTTPLFECVLGGRWGSVPKTSLIDRSILVEPRANAMIQKIIGANLRRLLKGVGVDLDDQTFNQQLAGLAQQLGLVTIDLAAASDTISRNVVRHLLPPRWFEAMDSVRSKYVQKPDGSWSRLEKFSSMGNGFTFELESLVFWALTEACADEVGSSIVGIYGDDIITSHHAVPLLSEVLKWCGFSLNWDKSFTTGRFYESCGYHWFDGFDVTPFNLDEVPKDTSAWIQLHNKLQQWNERCGHGRADGAIARVFREERLDRYAGPFKTRESGDYAMRPSSEDLSALRSRRGPFGLEYRVLHRVSQPVEIPANDDAMYAIRLQTGGPPRASPLAPVDAIDVSTLPSRETVKVGDVWRWVTSA